MKALMLNLISDRITRGIIAGIISHIPALAFNLASQALGFSTLIWKDYMNIFLHGESQGGLAASIVSIISVSLFVGALGGIFSFVSPALSSKNYLIKSWYYSMGLWFIFHAITVLYRVPEVKTLPTGTVLSQGIAATIWGLALGLLLIYFEGNAKDYNKI